MSAASWVLAAAVAGIPGGIRFSRGIAAARVATESRSMEVREGMMTCASNNQCCQEATLNNCTRDRVTRAGGGWGL